MVIGALVCVSVRLSVTTFSATMRNDTTKIVIPTGSALHWLDFNLASFVKVLRSRVMA